MPDLVFELSPVTAWDVANDIRCMACNQPFKAGEHFVDRAIDAVQEYRSEPVLESVCVACAFTGEGEGP